MLTLNLDIYIHAGGRVWKLRLVSASLETRRAPAVLVWLAEARVKAWPSDMISQMRSGRGGDVVM